MNPATAMIFQRYLLAILLVITTALTACSSEGDRQSSSAIKSFDISQYQGEWVVINYWAEWCLPCIEEIPELNTLAASHAGDIKVFAVNFDRLQGEELSALATKMGIKFGLIEQDPADVLRLARPMALPTTYVFNREGELSAKLVGPQTEASLLSHTDLQHGTDDDAQDNARES